MTSIVSVGRLHYWHGYMKCTGKADKAALVLCCKKENFLFGSFTQISFTSSPSIHRSWKRHREKYFFLFKLEVPKKYTAVEKCLSRAKYRLFFLKKLRLPFFSINRALSLYHILHLFWILSLFWHVCFFQTGSAFLFHSTQVLGNFGLQCVSAPGNGPPSSP